MIGNSTRGRRDGRGSFRAASILTALLAFACSSVRAESAPGESDPALGVLSGQVRSVHAEPVGDALVKIDELRWQTTTDAQGRFRFERVPKGRYVLSVTTERHGRAVRAISVLPGERSEVELNLTKLREQLVVTADPAHRGIPTVGKPVSVVTERNLERRLKATLGDTLVSTPGLNSTSHAAGASRPILRGFGGDRARILEDGLSVADASGSRSDNAVATDPNGLDRIEILRGPSLLRYGSNAVGGVVNLVDGRIPDRVPNRRIGGSVNLRATSNAGERSDSLHLDGGWRDLSWKLSALERRSDDADTPIGALNNSDLDTEQASAGASWMLGRGYVGIAHQGFDTEYGIPTDREIRIDMKRRRWEVAGEFPRDDGFLSGFKAHVGYTDYDHAEAIPGADFGSGFRQETTEARFEAPHGWWTDRGEGSLGAQLWDRDLTVDGPGTFLPPNRTQGLAVFATEELTLEPFAFQIGARWESVDVETDDAFLPDRSFNGFSMSAGFTWGLDEWEIGATVSRTTRLPTSEELFSDGPHLSVFQYEIGNPDLTEERASSLELSVRRTQGRLTGELALFSADYDDYVYLVPTGNTVQVGGEEVPELVTLQRDARYRGAEARLRFDLYRSPAHHVELELRGDTVRGEVDKTATGRWLPKIPASRAALGVRYEGSRVWGGLELVRTSEQDRVQLFEAPTESHAMFNAHGGFRIHSRHVVHDILIVATNIADELARNHASPLKEIAPLAGQDVSVSYKVQF